MLRTPVPAVSPTVPTLARMASMVSSSSLLSANCALAPRRIKALPSSGMSVATRSAARAHSSISRPLSENGVLVAASILAR